MDWLPNVERIKCGTSGGSWKGGPFRIVLHRTEGSSIEGAVQAYKAKNVAPHLTVDLRKQRVVQHLPFSGASRALQNKLGGVETNRRSSIQIEIVGFSHDAHLDDDVDLSWFGAQILAPIMADRDIKPVAPAFYGDDCGWVLATEDARQRMSFEEWDAFNGVCSHQHVPEQSHWDCGQFKINVVLGATQPQEDFMAQLTELEQRDLYGIIKRALDTQELSLVKDSTKKAFATEFIKLTNADTYELRAQLTRVEGKLDALLGGKK